MRMVVARCSASYVGRLSSELAADTYLIVVKADGSLAIHADVGAYKPLNWMNAPNTLVEDDVTWTVTSPKGELLEIFFEEVLSDVTVALSTTPALVLDGVEAQLQELLTDHPQHIAAGMTLVRREWQTAIGPVDLMCRDAAGQAVAVEVKRVLELPNVEQLSRYLEVLNSDGGDPQLGEVRGMLVACEVKPQARTLAARRGIDCVEVSLAALRGEADPALRLFDL